ncbi:MAG TPA: 50S ribosomal protein L23 [Candidatus Azoamicus sp. OHIO2]
MIKETYLYNIIKGQYSTEKTVKMYENFHCITFNVDINANKYKIKNAIEKIFNVKVLSVNTITSKAKKVKFKNIVGKKNNFKKAIVKLKKGYDINFGEFE